MLSNAVPVTLRGDNTLLRLAGESIVMAGGTVSLAGGVGVKNSFIGAAPAAVGGGLGRVQFASIVARTGEGSEGFGGGEGGLGTGPGPAREKGWGGEPLAKGDG